MVWYNPLSWFGRNKKKFWILVHATGEFEKQSGEDGSPKDEVTEQVLKGISEGQNFTLAVLRNLAGKYYFKSEATCDEFLELIKKAGGKVLERGAKKSSKSEEPKAASPKAVAKAPTAKPTATASQGPKPTNRVDEEALIASIKTRPVNDDDFDVFVDGLVSKKSEKKGFKLHREGKSVSIVEITVEADDKTKFATAEDIQRVRDGDTGVAFRRFFTTRQEAEAMFKALKEGLQKKK